MKAIEETKPIADDAILDDYGHLPFKRAGNRFAKYRNARIFVIDDNGEECELAEYEEKMKAVEAIEHSEITP